MIWKRFPYYSPVGFPSQSARGGETEEALEQTLDLMRHDAHVTSQIYTVPVFGVLLWKASIRLFYIVNSMAADGLTMQGTRVLIQYKDVILPA